MQLVRSKLYKKPLTQVVLAARCAAGAAVSKTASATSPSSTLCSAARTTSHTTPHRSSHRNSSTALQSIAGAATRRKSASPPRRHGMQSKDSHPRPTVIPGTFEVLIAQRK